MKLFNAAVALAFAATLAAPAQANVITYTSSSSYNAATNGNTSINFSGMDNGSYTYFGNALTTDGVTFSEAESRLFVLKGNYYSGYNGPAYLNNNGGSASVGITFAAPVLAFALDFGSIENWGGGSLVETFTFAGYSSSITLPSTLVNHGHTSFVGFLSDTPFTSVTITDPTHGLLISDLKYHAAPVTPPADSATSVPEPGSLALLGLGLLGFAAARRKRQA